MKRLSFVFLLISLASLVGFLFDEFKIWTTAIEYVEECLKLLSSIWNLYGK